MGSILYIIAAILLIVWLFGLLIDIGGGLIHLLLVIGLIIVAYQFLTGRRRI
jgi:hypothetical protein